jgi:hypothetical protein
MDVPWQRRRCDRPEHHGIGGNRHMHSDATTAQIQKNLSDTLIRESRKESAA